MFIHREKEREKEKAGQGGAGGDVTPTFIKEPQSSSASPDDHRGVSEVFEISTEEIQVQAKEGQLIHAILKFEFLSHWLL